VHQFQILIQEINLVVMFLCCGTPKGYGNWAYELYLKGKQDDDWESFQYTTIEGGMVSAEELEQAKQDVDIRTFRQEFEGAFRKLRWFCLL
jgi:hypothetical protein